MLFLEFVVNILKFSDLFYKAILINVRFPGPVLGSLRGDINMFQNPYLHSLALLKIIPYLKENAHMAAGYHAIS